MPAINLRTTLPAALICLVVGVALPPARSAPLPAEVGRLHGEVAVIQDQGGEDLQAGTRILTGRDGRAELLMAGQPSLWLGPDSELLLHSADRKVLRARLDRGTLHVDTRADKGRPRRDLRLNAGDMRLQVIGGEIWIEHSEDQTQVCSITGLANLMLDGRDDRLDFPGQCVRRQGPETAWTLVPMPVLDARVALLDPDASAPSSAVASASDAPAGSAAPPAAVPADPAPALPLAPAIEAVPVPSLAQVEVPEPVPDLPETEVPDALDDAPAPAPAAAAAVSAVVPVTEPGPAALDPVLAENLARAEQIAADRASAADDADKPRQAPARTGHRDPVPAAAATAVPAAEVEMAADAAAVEARLAGESRPASAAVPAMAGDDGRRWSVVLASMSTRQAAQEQVERLRGFGIRSDAALAELRRRRPDLPGWVARY